MTVTRPASSGWMAAVTALLVAGYVALRVVLEPRFFYWDDVQHTFAPVFYTIGEALREGYWPATSPLLWQGGFFAGEGLYQLFNPISLALFALLPSIDDIAAGMALHAGIWLVIAALGAHTLAVRLGSSSHWAVLAGFSYATSPFLVYWLAASWVNGAVAFAALPWALAFLAERRLSVASVAGLAFATYLVAVSGWIHAIIALFLFGSCRLLLPDAQVSMRDRVVLGCGLAAGALLASPQLLSTVAAVQGSMRPSNISNLGRAVASLQGLVTLFWPAYVQPSHWFSDNRWSPPIYYAAWFILPAALLVMGRVRESLRGFNWLTWPLLVLVIATLGPEQLGPTRWPIRFLPAAWAAAIPLAAVILSRVPPVPTRPYHLQAGVAVLAAVVLTWQQNPGGFLTLAALAVALWALASVSLKISTAAHAGTQRLACLFGTILLALWLAAAYPVNIAFDDYHAPARRTDVHRLGMPYPGSIVQIYSRLADEAGNEMGAVCATRCESQWNDVPFSSSETAWVPSGNMPLWRRERLVNGYTPVEMLSLKTLTCGHSIFGWTCDGPGPQLLSTEKATGKRFIDLMRIEAVVISARMPQSLALFGGLPDWTADSPSEYATIFRRRGGPVALPGTLSHVPDGVQVVTVPVSEAAKEQVALQRPAGFSGGLLAFARPYYPGFRATIDGRSIPVEPLGGVVVAVRLPAGQGPTTVEVRHELPMPALWRSLVLLGLLALGAGIWLVRKTPTVTAA